MKTLPSYVLMLFLWAALPPSLFGHRLDEYLQATLVTIEPGKIRLQINLTPGVAVADAVLPFVDRNRDGIISTNEAAAYCELLKRDLVLVLDQHKLNLNITASNFPAPADLRTGWAIIQVEFSATLDPLTAGTHKLVIQNRHLPKVSVYLCNAAQPKSKAVQITQQKRNDNQSECEMGFTVEPGKDNAQN
ncbi:MAG TPA: hypothetical protein VNU68_04200 [Verrucomicrobiae bacterium]|nr:hypothetical protein [Verrucomicrobiae bacterium]